ncbi:glycosyltransferase family 39 protein [Candidatus Woesebacteria bacterium]|nr:glycosyltransferase family 39 protein [Candidatus Woesebacteria bacterium]
MFDYQTIFSFLKKNIKKKDVVILLILVGLFFLMRLVNLTKWPIFSDEGIYIRWAKTAWKDASWRFISLTDGRQPLQTWATIPFLKLFPHNALLAGRLFSVLTGFTALSGMFCLLYYLWGKKAAYIGALLHIFIPYFLFYDRMALVDSAVNAGFIWILFFSLLLVKTRKLDVALMFGFVGGFASLAKSSMRIFLALSAMAPVLYLTDWKKRELLTTVKKTLNYFILLAIVIVISLLFYNVQRLSPFFHYVAMKNTTFVMTLDEFLTSPFAVFWRNIQLIPLYASWEAGWLIVPFSVFGLYRLVKNNRLLGMYMLLWFVIPFFGIAFMAKVLFPRYIIFYGSLFVITATYGLMELKKEKKTIYKRGYLFAILLVTMILLDMPMLFAPAKASFPEVDRGQYIEGATAVWGAQDLVQTLRTAANNEKEPVVVLAEGDFGLVADVLRVFVQDTDRIEIRGLWPLSEEDIFKAMHEVPERRVFVVFSHRDEFPSHWPIVLIKKYEKPGNQKALYLYEIKTDALSCDVLCKSEHI